MLIDWKMPGKDGLQTVREVRYGPLGPSDPIVILVAPAGAGELANHADANLADAVLQKPVTPSALYNAVIRALHGRRGGALPVPLQGQQRLVGLRILVVDDSDINREVAQRIFVSEGAHVVTANDGQSAIDWLQTPGQIADIVLMDVQMPVLNGYEATRRIRQIPAFADLPIVALTAGIFEDQQAMARQAGMTRFISKPFDVDAVIALILKLTGYRPPVPAAAPVRVAPTPTPTPALPGLAVATGLANWGSAEDYQKFLRRFAQDYGDVVARLRTLEGEEAEMLVHKFRGAAANMALVDVPALAGDVEARARAGEPTAEALAHLQSAMDIVLQSIARYVAEPVASAPVEKGRDSLSALVATDVLDAALRTLLEAWDSEQLQAVRLVLATLADSVPAAWLTPVQAACDAYDFAAGSAATHALIKNYQQFSEAQ